MEASIIFLIHNRGCFCRLRAAVRTVYEITQVPCMAHADCKHWYWQGSPWRPLPIPVLAVCMRHTGNLCNFIHGTYSSTEPTEAASIMNQKYDTCLHLIWSYLLFPNRTYVFRSSAHYNSSTRLI